MKRSNRSEFSYDGATLMGSSPLSIGRTAMITAAWGMSLFGVLQIQFLPLDAGHSICGPWGCGPPLPPLIAYHTFWLFLLTMPTVVICRRTTPARLRRYARYLLIAGFSGLIVVGLWDLIPSLPHWLPRVKDLAPKYYVQRYLLSLITLVDVPIIPILLAGFCCLATSRRFGRE